MNKTELIRIQGELINAVANGGERALWNIARGKHGTKAAAASEVIELATSPFHEVNLIDAIILVTSNLEGGEN